MFKNYSVLSVVTLFSASDWTFEGRTCICDLPTPQRVSTFSLQGKEAVVLFSETLLANVKNRLLQTSSSWIIK